MIDKSAKNLDRPINKINISFFVKKLAKKVLVKNKE